MSEDGQIIFKYFPGKVKEELILNKYNYKPAPGDICKHFKGKLYQVITLAVHSETKEQMVVYQKLYDDFSIYVRPLKMFISEVDHEKYPDAAQQYRFEKIYFSKDDDNLIQNKKAESKCITVDTEDAAERVNPLLIKFLDAETYSEKLDIFLKMKKDLDDKLIDDIAVAIDVVIPEGPIDKRYSDLRESILTFMRYEQAVHLRH